MKAGTMVSRKAKLAEALETWWAHPTQHNWVYLLPALYEVVFLAAEFWGRKMGLRAYGDLSYDDLAQSAVERFQWEFFSSGEDQGESSATPMPSDNNDNNDNNVDNDFNDGDDGDDGGNHASKIWRRKASGRLTRQSLADMHMDYEPGAVVAYLIRRAELEFQEVFRREERKRADPMVNEFEDENGDGEPRDREFEDRQSQTPVENLILAIPVPRETRLANDFLKKIWVSGPKKFALEAYLLQLCLTHANCMAPLGVPRSVFSQLNCLEADGRRTVRKAARAKIQGSGEAIQGTTIGLFMNSPRNTALKRVEAFDEFIRQEVQPECDAAGTDSLSVCRCLLGLAVEKLVAERAEFWSDEPRKETVFCRSFAVWEKIKKR